MKQLYISIVTLTLSSQVVRGQETQIAIKAGWNYSTASVSINNVKQPTQFNNGFGIGILFKAPFDGNLHFSPYISFNQRGYGYRPITDTNHVTQYKNTINYIDIVPALSYDLPYKGNSFVFSFGPEFSYALSGTEDSTIGGITHSGKMQFAIDENYGPIDIGVVASIGYHTKKVFAEAGFQLGVVNIDNNTDYDNRNIQNRMLSVDIGYYLK